MIHLEGRPSSSTPSWCIIQETADVLQCLSIIHIVEQYVILATMDVTSLYTNTPHRKGLLALKHFFDLRVEDDGLPSTFGLPSTNVVLFVLSRLFLSFWVQCAVSQFLCFVLHIFFGFWRNRLTNWECINFLKTAKYKWLQYDLKLYKVVSCPDITSGVNRPSDQVNTVS